MEENAFSVSAVVKPITEITKILSNEVLKVYQLTEHCKFIESDLEKWYAKVENLTSAKYESSKIVAEYKKRNKINVINSESLLQSLHELYNYKSELKSTYIATEKALKKKRLKYQKIVTSYEGAWQKALNEYNTDPVFMELNKIQRENTLLEEEIEKQEKLNACTETQLIDLKQHLKMTLRNSIVEFAKAMLQYRQNLYSTNQHRMNESPNQTSKGNFHFKLFKTVAQYTYADITNDEDSYTPSVDVSVFDDVTVPTENLESQNLEEELADVSREQETTVNYPQTIEHKTIAKGPKENVASLDDNESHYFRQQASENLRQRPSENLQSGDQWNRPKENKLDSSGERLKSVNVVGEESFGDMQMEYEESVSDGSYEKQLNNQKEDDSHGHKTSSINSEEHVSVGENLNESTEPGIKFCEQNIKSDLEKNEFKGFTGFFSMANDHDTSKPSIFKLF